MLLGILRWVLEGGSCNGIWTRPVVKKLLPSSSDIIGSKVKGLPFRSLLVLFCFRIALYQWSRRAILIQNCTLILDRRCIQSNLSTNIFKAGIKKIFFDLDGRTSLGSRKWWYESSLGIHWGILVRCGSHIQICGVSLSFGCSARSGGKWPHFVISYP